MADPVLLQIKFDASGRTVIADTVRGLDALNVSLSRVTSAAGLNSRALRAAQNDLNAFATTIGNRMGAALTFATRAFQGLYEVGRRLAQIGFYKVTAEFIGLVVAAEKVSKAFLQINERFAGLQITLKSAFGSLTIARQLREELLRIAPASVLPIKELESALRSFSVIPFTRSQIAKEAVQGQFQTLNQGVNLISQLRIFRPDKSAEEAIFAIREALTGQFRSIIRRFDIPSSALAVASGKTLKELTNQPEEILKAMLKFFGGIISPGAVREFQRQPSVIFEKLKEQLGQLPLLFIGDAGLYNKVTTTLGRLFETVASFVSTGVKPYTTRIAKALGEAFDIITRQTGGTFNNILSKFGLGSTQRPDLTTSERVAEGATRGIESLAKNLPDVLAKTVSFFEKLIPILEAVGKAALFVLKAFVEHPLQVTLAFALKGAIAGAIGEAFSSAKNTISRSIAAGISESLSRSGTLNAALQAGAAVITPTGRIRLTAPGGGFVSPNSFAQNTFLSRAGGAIAGFGVGAAGLASTLAPFVIAVGVFAGAVYAFEKVSNYLNSESAQKKASALGGSFARVSQEDLAQQLFQLRSDVDQVSLARQAQGLSRPGTLDEFRTGTGESLKEFLDNTVDIANDLSGIRDLLKPENAGKTFASKIRGNISSGDVSEPLLRLLEGKFGVRQSVASDIFNQGLQGIDSPFIPERRKVLTESRQAVVRNLQEEADKLDKSSFLTNEFRKTLGEVNDALRAQITTGDQLEGRLDEFREQFTNTFDPSKKSASVLGKLEDYLKNLDQIGNNIEAIPKVNILEDSIKARVRIEQLIKRVQEEASGDVYLKGALQPLLDSLTKQAEGIFSKLSVNPNATLTTTGFANETLTELTSTLSTARNKGIAALADTFLEDSIKLIEKLASVKSAAEGRSLVSRFAVDTSVFQRFSGLTQGDIFGAFGGETIGPHSQGRRRSGVIVNPFAEGFKATTLRRIQGQEGLVDFFNQGIGNLQGKLTGEATQDEALKASIQRFEQFRDKVLQENEALKKQIAGEGFFKSFIDGFTDVTEEWRATALNMKAIGKDIATSFATDMGNAFSEFELGTKSAGQAFQDFAKNFLTTAVNLLNKKAVEAILGFAVNAIGGLASIGGSSPIAYSSSGTPIAYSALASGGYIAAGSGIRDDVPALLTKGEYVVPSNVVSRYGSRAFDNLRGYAGGGVVGSPVMSGGNYSIVINVSGSETSSGNDQKGVRDLARQIKSAVVQILNDQKRQGGALRA